MLSEYKRAVLTTLTMRLTRKEALDYLKDLGYPIVKLRLEESRANYEEPL